MPRPQPLGTRRERQLAEEGGADLERRRPRRDRRHPRAADVEADDGRRLDAGLEDRVPVLPVPEAREVDDVGPLGQGDGLEAPGGVAPDLGGGLGGIGQARRSPAG